MKLLKASQNDLFYTQILLIAIDGKEEKVVLKELQREAQKENYFMLILCVFPEKQFLRSLFQ